MSPFQRRKIHMTGTRRTTLDQARGRLVLLSAFFVFVYIIVVARAADLSIIQGDMQHSEQGSVLDVSSAEDSQHVRADIIDRNGVILARSLRTASLYADPAMVIDPVQASKDIVNVFPDLSYGSVLQKLQSKKRFVWIKRNISPEEHAKVMYLGYPGLNFKEEMRRIYPQGPLAVHMVGTTGVDGQGLSGIEASFDKLLREKEEPLQLTLDVRLQHVLRREVSEAMAHHKAIGGAGIVMDVKNGEVVAAVSLPDFDPMEYSDATTTEKFNRVSLGVYELGSTFKIFSTAAYLENNKGDVSAKFDVREPIKIGRFKINDYHAEKRILTLPEVFIHSSNIGAAMMGRDLGAKELESFYEDIGLLTPPEFELNELGRPIVPSPWHEVNTLTASYGHGIAVSPLQLVRATASIINGGILVQPSLVMHKKEHKNIFKKSAMRVVSPQTSHRMRQLMRLVVTEGTGSKADVPGYLVGGKTGTAEKPGANGGYARKKLISSFLGAFPMDDPQYVVFVMVDEPQGTKDTYGYATGGWVGAPAFEHVVSAMVSILGVKPSMSTDRFEESLMRYVKTKEQLEKEQKIAAH